MKFLVLAKDMDYGGPIAPSDLAMILERVYKPSFETLKNWENDRKASGGIFAAQRAGAMIIEAQSAEELSSLMKSLPFWGRTAMEVVPLQTFQSAIDDLEIQIEQLKKMSIMAAIPA